MKAIMIAIKPKWCALIMNGDKTIEVRKNKALATAIQKLIDKQGFANIYVYCSKGKERLINLIDDSFYCGASTRLNGKVIFKFRCYKVEEIYGSNMISFEKDSCVDRVSMFKYLNHLVIWDNKLKNLLQANEGRKMGYAIHISDLEIFDKPKELRDFRKCYRSKGFPQNRSWNLTKAPQNFYYLEEI